MSPSSAAPARSAPPPQGEVGIAACSTHRDADGAHRFVCTPTWADGHGGDHEGTGGGPLTAFADALTGAGCAVQVLDVVEQPDVDGDVVAYARCRVGDDVRGVPGGTSPRSRPRCGRCCPP